MEHDSRTIEDGRQIAAKSAGRYGAVADQFVDVARIETGSAGPGMQFAPLRYGHLQAYAIGGFELPRIGRAAGRRVLAANRRRSRPRGRIPRRHALVVAAVHGFDADVLLQVVGGCLEPGAGLLQNTAGIARSLAVGHPGRDK